MLTQESKVCVAFVISLELIAEDSLAVLSFDEVHDLVVHNKNDSGTSSSENVSEGTLEETLWSFVLQDLGEAVTHSVVDLFGLWLGGLVLETSLKSIKRISSDTGGRYGNLGNQEFGKESNNGSVFLIWVESLDSILKTELGTSVHNDTNGGWTNTIVKRSNTVFSNSLLKAISDTIIFLDSSDIGTEGSTDIDQWVNEGVGNTTCNGTRGNLSHGELGSFSILVVYWEKSLDGILEHEVASSSWNVSDAVGNIASPEGSSSELTDMSLEAISHSCVSLHFSGKDLWVGILGLDGKLNFLKWSSNGLRNSTGDTSSSKVNKWVWLIFLLRHRVYDFKNKLLIYNKRNPFTINQIDVIRYIIIGCGLKLNKIFNFIFIIR